MQRETGKSLRRLHLDWTIGISRHAIGISGQLWHRLASLESFRNITLTDETGLPAKETPRKTEGAPACQRLTFSLRIPNATTIASPTGTTPKAAKKAIGSDHNDTECWCMTREEVTDQLMTKKSACLYRVRE